ncbi:MAG: phage holin, LLH family [Eubacteriales bacterium]
MKTEIITVLAEHLIEIVFAVLGIVISTYVVPWLKEKKLYDTVKITVRAAEKWAETHEIDKRSWVEEQLGTLGITITPLLSAMIESAVKELDTALGKVKS